MNNGTDSTQFQVEHTDHLWIEMKDGVRLAARLWRPITDTPVPAILEYIPYRKTDMVRARDERNHPYFASHGYACIRVDMRGSGDSEGHMPDMYAPAELDDARQVINWLAAQEWCSGRVGMFGTSWGGTASLQASVNAPEPLKAVIAVCATHDRFEDDIHHMGGCVLTDTFEWGATLPAILGSPPSENVGPDWKERWVERLHSLTFPLENWLRERGRGTYWRHGSVVHQAADLSVPILAVGGWSDRYSNSVMSLVDARPDLVWGVVGPWGHHFPDHGAPGPAIGFQAMALDWWDHWLRSEDPAQPSLPRLRAWLREFETPQDKITTRAGQWIETGPTFEQTTKVSYGLSELTEFATLPSDVPAVPFIGRNSGDTGYFGRPGGLPLDQQEDDDLSLVFETPPFDEDCVLYGAPELVLSCKINDEPTQIVARLSDISPDGVSARISYGIRNLALDDQLDLVVEPRVSDPFELSLRLHTTAYRIRKGHRVRIALSSTLWPLICSQLNPGSASIMNGSLKLPLMTGEPQELAVPFPPAEDIPQSKSHVLLSAPDLVRWNEMSEGAADLGWHQPMTKIEYSENGTTFGYETRARHRLEAQGALSEVTEISHDMVFDRPDGTAEVSVTLTSRSGNRDCTVEAELRAHWNGETMATRTWRTSLNKS